MTEEGKRMSVEDVAAAAMDLSPEDRITLLERVEDSLYSDAIDAADIEDSHRIMEDIEAGRMRTVPAEQVLEMLDRMAR